MATYISIEVSITKFNIKNNKYQHNVNKHLAYTREQRHNSRISTFQERQEKFSIYTIFIYKFNVLGLF